MLFEQTHYLPTGTNWNKVIVGTIVIISVCAIVYVACRPPSASKFIYKPKSKGDKIA